METELKKEKKAKKKSKKQVEEVEEPEIQQISEEVTEIEHDEEQPVDHKEKKIKKKRKAIEENEDNLKADADEEDENRQSSQNPENTPTPSAATIFSKEPFENLPVSEKIKKALRTMGFTMMTEIQSKSIPECLAGSDLVGAAKTGSGKTLAFLIPIVELLNRIQFTRKQGTGAIVISPTRELSLQIYGVLRDLIEFAECPQTHGLIMGGANRKAEAEKLIKGVNILVATPGRLLDHLANTAGFVYQRLQMLVIDEADRILDQGFEEDMHQIIKLLPSNDRQTILFSATQTRKVEDLARLSMKPNPVYTGVHDDSRVATVEGLQQGYVVCPAEKRFMLLYSFLKKNKNKKIMVFFSSCNSVKFHAELLNYIDIEVLDIHGNQKQQKRTTTFFTFCKQATGILLCTDVAARGLDIPAVDWIIQYDPPDDPKEYIHRVGRTARGTNTQGRALLFLLPEELNFLKYLKQSKVNLQEYEFPAHKIANINSQLLMLVEKNYYLHRSAKDAYRSYLLAYASHSHKDIFNVHEIDLQGLGQAFGFSVPPRVDLNFSPRGDRAVTRKNKKRSFGDVEQMSDERMNKKRQYAASGHAFSADNPYGKRAEGDKRQFSR